MQKTRGSKGCPCTSTTNYELMGQVNSRWNVPTKGHRDCTRLTSLSSFFINNHRRHRFARVPTHPGQDFVSQMQAKTYNIVVFDGNPLHNWAELFRDHTLSDGSLLNVIQCSWNHASVAVYPDAKGGTLPNTSSRISQTQAACCTACLYTRPVARREDKISP